MRTRSSHRPPSIRRGTYSDSPAAESKGKGVVFQNDSVAAGNAKWEQESEKALLQFLVEHKTEVGDGGNFKPSIWQDASTLLRKYPTTGGMKTAASCESKYGRWKKQHWDIMQLRGLPGVTWNSHSGLITGRESSVVKSFLKKHPQVAPLAANGFKYYDELSILIPNTAPGENINHPFKMQSRRKVGKAAQGTESAGLQNKDERQIDNELMPPLAPPDSATVALRRRCLHWLSTFPDPIPRGTMLQVPMGSPLGSGVSGQSPGTVLSNQSMKRKASALVDMDLDDVSSKRKHSVVDTAVSSSRSVSSTYGMGVSNKRMKFTGADALNGLKEVMEGLTKAIRERGQAEQAAPAPVSSVLSDSQPKPALEWIVDLPKNPSELSHMACDHVAIHETKMSPEHMIALMAALNSDPEDADTYLRIRREDVRKFWVQKKLKELGFSEEGTDAS